MCNKNDVNISNKMQMPYVYITQSSFFTIAGLLHAHDDKENKICKQKNNVLNNILIAGCFQM